MRRRMWIIIGVMLMLIVLVNCSRNDINAVDTRLTSLPLSAQSPIDNAPNQQKILLGKMLFWDPLLSGNKDVACASCHHPSFGFSDGLDLSIGVNGQGLGTARHFSSPNTIPFAKRNAISIVNSAFNGISAFGTYDPVTAPMFFDNRVQSLELQSLEPIKAMEEMRGKSFLSADILDSIVNRLKNIPQYVQLFNDAFRTQNAISSQNLGKAIASYERTILSNHSAYDEYIRGNKTAMTSGQIQGMNDFVSNGCVSCHSGPMFSDYKLHLLSVPDNAKESTDAGANGSYAFRTPSLRNLSLTAPYMHSGVFRSLDAVLNFYEQVGNRRSQNPHVSSAQLDNNLRRIGDRDKQLIIQFLNALNDPNFDNTIPASVPSGLHPGGNL